MSDDVLQVGALETTDFVILFSFLGLCLSWPMSLRPHARVAIVTVLLLLQPIKFNLLQMC